MRLSSPIPKKVWERHSDKIYIISNVNDVIKRKFEMILDENKYRVVLKDGILNGTKIKRVWISGFRSEDEARDFKETNNLKTAMIIAQ